MREELEKRDELAPRHCPNPPPSALPLPFPQIHRHQDGRYGGRFLAPSAAWFSPHGGVRRCGGVVLPLTSELVWMQMGGVVRRIWEGSWRRSDVPGGGATGKTHRRWRRRWVPRVLRSGRWEDRGERGREIGEVITRWARGRPTAHWWGAGRGGGRT